MRTRIQCELVKGRAGVANGSHADSGTASASSVESALTSAPGVGGCGVADASTAAADASPPEQSPSRFTRLVRPSLSPNASHVHSREPETETEPELGFGFCLQCLNDVAIHRKHDYCTAQIDLYVNGRLATTVVGDGTLINTTSTLVLYSVIMYSLTKPPVLMS